MAAIKKKLEKRDSGYQARWDKVWGDELCQKYRRHEHEDWWLWNHDFYSAPIPDLRHIASLGRGPLRLVRGPDYERPSDYRKPLLTR